MTRTVTRLCCTRRRFGRFAFIDQALIRYRYSPGQLSGEANSTNMMLAILRVLEELPGREPDVVRHAPALYRRRLATAYLNAARVLADTDRSRALAASWQALRLGGVSAALLKTSLHACLPALAVDGIRRVKRLAGARTASALAFAADVVPEVTEMLLVIA